MPPLSPQSALTLLPRSLKISASTPITRTHIVALYKEQMRVAYSFSSYNFKQYFIRRTREKFRTELPNLMDPAYASPKSTSHAVSSKGKSSSKSEGEENSIYAPTAGRGESKSVTDTTGTTTSEERLRKWFSESLSELAVMSRAAITNRMYEVPKLVVEGRNRVMISGGGGSGAEASYGGAGQPVAGQATNPDTPVN